MKAGSNSYIESWIEEVKRRFAISTEILNTDYYRYVMEALEQPPNNTAEASETDDTADTEKSEKMMGKGIAGIINLPAQQKIINICEKAFANDNILQRSFLYRHGTWTFSIS